jgi:hypothetical protein
MRAPLPTAAIRCQVNALVAYGLEHDDARLFVRGMFRDGLERLKHNTCNIAQLAPVSRAADAKSQSQGGAQ